MGEQELAVTLQTIKDARERIREHAVHTPCLHMHNLSNVADAEIYLKLETLQRCKAFKFRGALSKISTLPKGSTVVCASAGNHSQGTALSAKLMGMKSIVYMPTTAPASKVAATKGYGATVVQFGASFDEAQEKCLRDVEEHSNWTFIPPFNDDLVIAGQGTIGLEIYEDLKNVDTVVVAVGGGGLAAGVGLAIKSLKPDTRVIAVNASVRPNTYKRFQKLRDLPEDESVRAAFNGTPLADGIAVKNYGVVTDPYIQKYVDEFVVVTEDEIAQAISLIAERAKVISEGAGAATFAAVLAKKFSFRPDERICCVLSGGNIELQMLARCAERAAFLQKHRVTFNVTLPVPSAELVKMINILNEFHVQIHDVHALPHYNSLCNNIRYEVTIEMGDVSLIGEINEKFVENNWTMEVNATEARK